MSLLESRSVEKSITALLWVLTLFILVLGFNAIKERAFIGGGVPIANVITVSGEGEMFAVPDIAQFSFSVVEERDTVEEAQREATQKTKDLVTFLEEQDIEEKDVRTTRYNVNPRYEYRTVTPELSDEDFLFGGGDRTRVLVGYQVTQSIVVKVRNIDQAGDVLAGVGSRGVSNVSGLSFVVDDEDSVERDARKDAIANAKEKAEELAKDLGVSLVRIVDFSEGGGYYPSQYAQRSLEVAALSFDEDISAEIPVGENRIVSNVTITYEIR